MTVQEAYIYVLDRLNKDNTDASQSISQRAFISAFNKMQYFWMSKRLEVDDLNSEVQEELGQFLVPVSITPKQGDDFLYIEKPVDYFRYKRMTGIDCGECGSKVYADKAEEGAAGTLLLDDFQNPSLEWQETFFTVVGKNLRFYADFKCDKLELIYYRNPLEINMVPVGANIDPELTGSDLYEVLDLTASLLASDIGDGGRFNTLSQLI